MGGGDDDDAALRLDLEQSREAPSLARAAITGLASEIRLDSVKAAALKLLVSEIVTNAVKHPKLNRRGKINLRADIGSETIRVEVTDQGDGFDPKAHARPRDGGGYGLFLLDKQADRWGVERRAGTTVWFELAT